MAPSAVGGVWCGAEGPRARLLLETEAFGPRVGQMLPCLPVLSVLVTSLWGEQAGEGRAGEAEFCCRLTSSLAARPWTRLSQWGMSEVPCGESWAGTP